MPASSTTVHSILKSEESSIWSKPKINVLILAIEVIATNLFSFLVHHTHIVITIIFHFRSSTAHSHNWYLLLRRRSSTFFKKFNQAKTPKIFNKSTRYFSKKNSLRCFVIYWLVISLLHTFKPFIHVHFDCYGKNYCKQHNGRTTLTATITQCTMKSCLYFNFFQNCFVWKMPIFSSETLFFWV